MAWFRPPFVFNCKKNPIKLWKRFIWTFFSVSCYPLMMNSLGEWQSLGFFWTDPSRVNPSINIKPFRLFFSRPLAKQIILPRIDSSGTPYLSGTAIRARAAGIRFGASTEDNWISFFSQSAEWASDGFITDMLLGLFHP